MHNIFFRDLHETAKKQASEAKNSIDVFSPFITTEALKRVLSAIRPNLAVNIITRWKMIDFLMGSASLDLYEYCSSAGFTLYINSRLHLKTIVRDHKFLTLGSANVTNRGLGLFQPRNHEVLVEISENSRSYIIYLESIRSQSLLVTEDVFSQFQKAIEDSSLIASFNADNLSVEDERLYDRIGRQCAFLISELPMSRDISQLFLITEDLEVELDDEIIANAQHDIAKYELIQRTYTSELEFRNYLSQKFFNRPFIQALCHFIDQPRRFGSIKAWVQENCTDVPVPSRRDLTENVQVLYTWLTELGKERFITYRPNHSEVIAPKDQ